MWLVFGPLPALLRLLLMWLNWLQVFVRYTGRLASNSKVFDSNATSSKPFAFRLGKREVITGWDEGIKGI